MILIGDIGATRTRLAIVSTDNDRLHIVRKSISLSREHQGLTEAARQFLSEGDERPRRACFGVAGPVEDGRVELTNLGWVLDARELGRALNIADVHLINDLEAVAWSLNDLDSGDMAVLNCGDSDAKGNRGIIAAGTGLGEAGLYWDGKTHHPFASEGGHCDFSPRNRLEMELLEFLRERYDHVSWERLLSGNGLVNLYRFFSSRASAEVDAPLAAEIEASADPAAAVSAAALEQRCPICEQALELFVSLYGCEAGNLALKCLTRGGIYVSGGIAPQIVERIFSGPFLTSFQAKGRMRELLEEMPVRVLTTGDAGLIGAARFALVRGDDAHG